MFFIQQGLDYAQPDKHWYNKELKFLGKGTQRLTLVKEGEHWRAGDEVEQIGIIQQEIVDMLGKVISKVRK